MRLVVQVEIYLDPIWVTNNYAVHVFFCDLFVAKTWTYRDFNS